MQSKNAAEHPPEHPSILALRPRPAPPPPPRLTQEAVRALALAAGADDAAVVSLDHPDLSGERPFALAAMPAARTLASLVLRTPECRLRTP